MGGEQAEEGQGDQPAFQELWFIVVMAGIALLLLAVVLGVVLHKVRYSAPLCCVNIKYVMEEVE